MNEVPIAKIADEIASHFGGNLRSVFQLGSLAHGGFAPLVSDVDIAIVLRTGISEGSVAAAENLKKHFLRLKYPLAERYSLFVGTLEEINSQDRALTRFTPFDILDFKLHGTLIRGEDNVREFLRAPEFAEVVASTAEFCFDKLLEKHFPDSFLHPLALFHANYVSFSKLVLFPPRFIYTLHARVPASNEEAVKHYLKYFKNAGENAAGLALEGRTRMLSNTEAASIKKESLQALYLNFLKVYSRELAALGAADLQARAELWRDKIASL